jgi:hypothetical protein
MVLTRRGLFIKSPGLRVPHNEVGAPAYGSVSVMSMDFGVPLLFARLPDRRCRTDHAHQRMIAPRSRQNDVSDAAIIRPVAKAALTLLGQEDPEMPPLVQAHRSGRTAANLLGGRKAADHNTS